MIHDDVVVHAHKFSTYHRERLRPKDLCGCFYCGDQFILSDVTDWVDGNSTALCPSCGIDSVVGMPDMILLGVGLDDFDDLLLAMKVRWFS